jgi:hypothetical protein
MITDVILDQKRVNICEHTLKTAPHGTYLQLAWRHLYHIFTYIYSIVIEKDICNCQNVSVKFPCVYVCLLSGDLFVFSVRVDNYIYSSPVKSMNTA